MLETPAQRRQRRARADVSRVAVRLFAEQGYAATTTEQVAQAADLSRSTLFRYFSDKDDLVFAIEDDLLAVSTSAVADAAGRTPWSALRAAALAVAQEVAAMRELMVRRHDVVATSPGLQARAAGKHRRWADALAGVLQQAYGLDPSEAALLPRLAVACFEVAEQQWLTTPDADLERLLEQAFDRLPRLLDG